MVQRKIAVWVAKKPDIFGLFAGDIFFVYTLWYARLDSNQRPSESESDALSNCATGAYQNGMKLWGSAIFQNSGQIVVNGGRYFPLRWLEATDCKGLRRFAADRT